ncbi:Protein TIC110, chloroplastic, partial [Mucuna pruriens]
MYLFMLGEHVSKYPLIYYGLEAYLTEKAHLNAVAIFFISVIPYRYCNPLCLFRDNYTDSYDVVFEGIIMNPSVSSPRCFSATSSPPLLPKDLNGIEVLVDKLSPPLLLATSAAVGYGLGSKFGVGGAGAAYALNAVAPQVAAVNLHNYVIGLVNPFVLKKEDIDGIANRNYGFRGRFDPVWWEQAGEAFKAEICDIYSQFMSAMLPLGDEELKDDEADKISFKNSLGIDDPDAAAMHMEEGRGLKLGIVKWILSNAGQVNSIVLLSQPIDGSGVSQAVEELDKILAFNNLLISLKNHLDVDRIAQGGGPVSLLGGDYDGDRRIEDLKLLYRAYVANALSGGHMEDNKWLIAAAIAAERDGAAVARDRTCVAAHFNVATAIVAEQSGYSGKSRRSEPLLST